MASYQADQLKEKGNAAFKDQDYESAEAFYTQAIQKYSKNQFIFTNRANARLKLQKWEGAVDDCLKSIEISGHRGQNHKAYYFLAQAQLALHHPNEALSSAETAYQQVRSPMPAAKIGDKDLMTFSQFVLQCKQAKFAARDRERLRRQGDLRAELEASLEATRQREVDEISLQLEQHAIGQVEASERSAEIVANFHAKIADLRAIFMAADPASHRPREVPDHLVDMVTFEPMHDPVITKHGHSYERATIYEHLKRSPTDPLTREPLTRDDLRPNVGLRQACEAFWEKCDWISDCYSTRVCPGGDLWKLQKEKANLSVAIAVLAHDVTVTQWPIKQTYDTAVNCWLTLAVASNLHDTPTSLSPSLQLLVCPVLHERHFPTELLLHLLRGPPDHIHSISLLPINTRLPVEPSLNVVLSVHQFCMAIWAGIGIIRPRKAEGRKTIEPRSMAFSPARGQQYNMLEVQVQCDQISRGLVESVASPGRDENPYDGSDVNPFQFVEAQIMPQRCDALLCSECCRYLKAAESCETRKDPEEARSLRERNGMLVRMLYNVKCTYQRLESEAQGTPWTRPKPGEVFRPVLSFRSLFIPEQFTRFSADLLVG